MKNIILFGLVCLGLFVGCQAPPPFEILKVSTDRVSRQDSFKIIKTDTNVAIGYLEEVLLTYTRTKEEKRIFYIFDKFLLGKGFVMDNGAAYRYDEKGQPVKLADYTVERAI
ncbi:MAG: hypothetical protein KAI63_05330, partial [Planctomycetes bacterium]|nr:hypothetical protein [Planctomycetota bacterium]